MVKEGGHADKHIGLDFVYQAQVAVGAHDFAATGANAENAELNRCIVGQPESQVRRVREHVDQLVFVLAATDFHNASAARGEVLQVMFRIKERDRIGGATGSA